MRCGGLGLPAMWGVMLLPLWRHAGAVHEQDLPHVSLFLKEGRFQPFLLHGAGAVGDAAFIDVSDPSGVAADVDVGLGHVPFIAFACSMLGFDEGHDRVSVESDASVVNVKIRCDEGVEHRNIVRAGCSEYHAHRIHDLNLVGGEEFLLRPSSRDVGETHRQSDGDQGGAVL
jgi:hypothetical protein